MTTRSFVRLRDGEIHYAEAGSGHGVLLLHQTPRSWAEFRDVLPLLGERYRAIAMDTIGMGDSTRPPWEPTVERWAGVAAEFLEALGVDRAAVVGHHTGGVIAFELAAARPDLVSALVLSSTPLVDDAFREERKRRPAPDDVARREDGSHLAELWAGRRPWYPEGRVELLDAFVVDALKVPDPAEGHHAVHAYDMTEKLAGVRAPTLVLGASDDPFAMPFLEPLLRALPNARSTVIEGGMVPLPDQLPEEFARAVLEFLDDVLA